MTFSDRLDLWAGNFGDEYHMRNPLSTELVDARARWLNDVFKHCEPLGPDSALDVGTGLGANLRALRNCWPHIHRAGTEPNIGARDQAIKNGACEVAPDAVHNLGCDNNSFDMVVTSGVLIHVSPAFLEPALREIYRVSKRWVLMAEYFAPEPEEIVYRGHQHALWRRDYGKMLMASTGALHVAHGFLWREADGMDNQVWWLMEKTV